MSLGSKLKLRRGGDLWGSSGPTMVRCSFAGGGISGFALLLSTRVGGGGLVASSARKALYIFVLIPIFYFVFGNAGSWRWRSSLEGEKEKDIHFRVPTFLHGNTPAMIGGLEGASPVCLSFLASVRTLSVASPRGKSPGPHIKTRGAESHERWRNAVLGRIPTPSSFRIQADILARNFTPVPKISTFCYFLTASNLLCTGWGGRCTIQDRVFKACRHTPFVHYSCNPPPWKLHYNIMQRDVVPGRPDKLAFSTG